MAGDGTCLRSESDDAVCGGLAREGLSSLAVLKKSWAKKKPDTCVVSRARAPVCTQNDQSVLALVEVVTESDGGGALSRCIEYRPTKSMEVCASRHSRPGSARRKGVAVLLASVLAGEVCGEAAHHSVLFHMFGNMEACTTSRGVDNADANRAWPPPCVLQMRLAHGAADGLYRRHLLVLPSEGKGPLSLCLTPGAAPSRNTPVETAHHRISQVRNSSRPLR